MLAADENQQVQKAQAGDRDAFAALVDRYWGRLWRWLYGLTHREHLAEDLTQEAFLRAWRSLDSFEPGASFRAWLFRIARNCLIDGRKGPRGTAVLTLPEAALAGGADPVEAALEREGHSLFEQACARLAENYRAPFLLWAQEGLSFAEIAQALGLTEETARWRVFRARLRLVHDLGNYLDQRKP